MNLQEHHSQDLILHTLPDTMDAALVIVTDAQASAMSMQRD